MEYAVMAETYGGTTLTLRRGFETESAAEDHPVTIKLWKRVWVTPIYTDRRIRKTPTLPPLPWSVASDASSGTNAYLIDADGNKIACIWGKAGQKTLVANKIVESVNRSAPAVEPQILAAPCGGTAGADPERAE